MNNKAEFYDKLLKRIVFLFCFLFLVFINVLRFYQLQTEEKPIVYPSPHKPLYLSFVLFQVQDQTHMIFLNRNNTSYFHKIFKEINFKTSNIISFINCDPNTFSAFKEAFINEFPNQHFSEEDCDISLNRLQELYDQNALILVVLRKQDLKHHKALHFAYQNKLKPTVKTVEIKNEI